MIVLRGRVSSHGSIKVTTMRLFESLEEAVQEAIDILKASKLSGGNTFGLKDITWNHKFYSFEKPGVLGKKITDKTIRNLTICKDLHLGWG